MIDYRHHLDRALLDHERQASELEAGGASDAHPSAPTRMPIRTDEQRHKESSERASRGDRVDYRRHLLIDLPTRGRIIPNEELTQAAKRCRTASLQAAAARRTERKNGGGTKVRGRDVFRSASREGHPEMTPHEDRLFRGWRPEGWFSK